jgi:hypothetical protein
MCVRIEEYTRMGLNNDQQYTHALASFVGTNILQRQCVCIVNMLFV